MTNKINSIFALGILIIISMACNFSFSTAGLSDLKFARDKNGGGASTTFKPEDEIFVITAVNNSIDKAKVKFRVLFDKVEGASSGAVAYKIEKELPVEGNGSVSFNFSFPQGLAPGSYKAEVVLTGGDGKELDRKTGTFTIAGDGSGKTTQPAKQSSDAANTTTDEHQDKDSDDN